MFSADVESEQGQITKRTYRLLEYNEAETEYRSSAVFRYAEGLLYEEGAVS